MKQLQKLHEQFIEKANRPMRLGALPIEPRVPEAPVVPVERWREAGGALYKTYTFRRLDDRDSFIVQLLAYERTTQHNAEIRIDGDRVDLKLQTKDLGKVTSIDKEHARYADVLYRGLVYSPLHDGDEG